MKEKEKINDKQTKINVDEKSDRTKQNRSKSKCSEWRFQLFPSSFLLFLKVWLFYKACCRCCAGFFHVLSIWRWTKSGENRFCLNSTKRRSEEIWLKLRNGRDVFEILFYSEIVVEIDGVEFEDDKILEEFCLHRTHLNSSFFLTLVKPTQTKWNQRSHASQQTPERTKSETKFSFPLIQIERRTFYRRAARF